MESFKSLVDKVDRAKSEADKFYVNENMQAGKRYFALLMGIQKDCKLAREELSVRRKTIREQRADGTKKV